MSRHDAHKALVAPLRSALYAGEVGAIRRALTELFAPEAKIQMGQPFDKVAGPQDLFERVYAPLLDAMPRLEFRDFILMAGPRWGQGKTGDWVGIGGNLVGTLVTPWLGIPVTGRPVFMRYHEYWRIEEGRVVEVEALWDIPQVMVQAGVWPMAPQLGVEWMCPGPADGRGIVTGTRDDDMSDASVRVVWDMLHDLKQGTADTPERGLGGFWHEQASW